MIIAIDFDGCLTSTYAWPAAGKPNWPVIHEAIRRQRSGDKLILWTCRTGGALKVAIDACAQWGLQFDAINENLPEILEKFNHVDSRKITAAEYWDDRAVIRKPICTDIDAIRQQLIDRIISATDDGLRQIADAITCS